MTRQKPMGTAETAALTAINGAGGVWKPDSRWRWESRHWTVLIFQALARRGLVREKVNGEVYEITASGRSYAAKIPAETPMRRLQPDLSAVRKRPLVKRSSRR